MELVTTILLFALGILLIIKGGDFFVDASTWIAERSGIPKLIIGATIVSMATTLPEVLVSVMAAAQEKVDMSIGNAVGSVTANIGLIMALALICMPGVICRSDYLFKSVLMITASALITACGVIGTVNPSISIILLIIFVAFIWENIRVARRNITQRQLGAKGSVDTPVSIAMVNGVKFIVGAVGIVIGAQLLVNNGSTLARLAGIPERVIGVTLVAIGTSLPELITAITAIVKKQSALSVGNILGANIIDLTLILPLSSLISGQALPISSSSAYIDLPACLLVGLIALIPALVHSRFSRWQGIVLLIVYGCYMVLTCLVA